MKVRGRYEMDDVVGIQHARRTSEEEKEMIKISWRWWRFKWEKRTHENPSCIPLSGRWTNLPQRDFYLKCSHTIRHTQHQLSYFVLGHTVIRGIDNYISKYLKYSADVFLFVTGSLDNDHITTLGLFLSLATNSVITCLCCSSNSSVK